MAWLLGSVTQAGAQTYTVKCRETGHFAQMNIIEVRDVPGHIVAVGESAGVSSCDDGSIATTSSKWMTDQTNGSGISQGYRLFTYEEGSTLWEKYQIIITAGQDGKTTNWEITGQLVKGTGRFEGIEGGTTSTGKRLARTPGAGAQYLRDVTMTYTLPSK